MRLYLQTLNKDRYLNLTLSQLYMTDFSQTQINFKLHKTDTLDYKLCWTIKKFRVDTTKKYIIEDLAQACSQDSAGQSRIKSGSDQDQRHT